MSSYHQNPPSRLAKTAKGIQWNSWSLGAATVLAGLTAQSLLASGPVPKPSPSIESCLGNVCAGRTDCVQFPNQKNASKATSWMAPFNLGQIVTPTAIVRPKDAQEVASVVRCAIKHGVKVQAKSGGHGWGNHGLGGEDGAISVDMEHFQYTQDAGTNNIRVGGGTRLSQIDEHLSGAQRAIPHGMCMGIGIGGHATVGGLGPMSRMWGTTLDHVEEVEVVTANATIVRASSKENSDLFFAMRGAGAGFGIVTDFVMRTRRAPSSALHFNQSFSYSHPKEIAEVLLTWQSIATDQTLDNRFSTEMVFGPSGARISSTWFGSEAELYQTDILNRVQSIGGSLATRQETWNGSLARLAAEEALHTAPTPNKLYSKSLGLSSSHILSNSEIASLLASLPAELMAEDWSIKFQAAGGAVAEVPVGSTAYAHRDKVMFYQSYAPDALNTTRASLGDFHRKLLNTLPNAAGTYPGFVDAELRAPQSSYWGSGLAVLEEIKAQWDPEDVFHNPQSVAARV
ncbi:hypothetical protein CORC01_06470 [Colletotrichum orchidophilum]|uniref:FAD-binding PCMH-type domain-containing protein n=1 Tax=Colletotrichum orchidophilum TaxID=1209926 RepID=A0A1G4BA49_9PEZI|nr:uncharacterized protein CORC01_06470 [Colletotrichum orchidophilum]OHE98273.1 hypothetical protein CORC01_06470 [Colletotrichum orchidophilum]